MDEWWFLAFACRQGSNGPEIMSKGVAEPGITPLRMWVDETRWPHTLMPLLGCFTGAVRYVDPCLWDPEADVLLTSKCRWPWVKAHLASLLRQQSSPQRPQMSLWTWIKVMGNVCPLWAASRETDELTRGSYREILSEHRVIVLWLLERKWNIQHHCIQEMPWPRKCNPSELFSSFLSLPACVLHR